MNYDNPAYRLLSIIERGKEIPVGASCRSAWQIILDVEDNNPLLMSRLGKVMELPELSIQALRDNFPQQSNTWSHWEMQINAAFMSQNLNSEWATFITLIDTHSVNYLRLSSDLLQAKTNTKAILGSEISQVREALEGILVSILESDIKGDIKIYLVRNLRRIIISMDEYKLTGALPILDSIESTLGHAHIDPQYKDFLRNEDIGKRLLDSLGAMANLLTVAVGLPQLTQALVMLPN